MPPEQDRPELVEVRILSLPIPVYLAAREHSDGLMREFQLLALGNPQGGDVPHRLVQLAERLSASYAGFAVPAAETLAEAEAAGRVQVDLTYHLPPEAAAGIAELGALLDEADRFCAGGEYLLTLVTPPEAVAFRRWFIDEVIRQIAGDAPRPWPEWRAAQRAAEADRVTD